MTETPPPLPASARRKSCLPIVLVAALLLVLAIGGIYWWYNRPIQPVVLTPQEKELVEAKVVAIQAPTEPTEPTYEKGGKEIILTERELNGLLNEHTEFGKSVKFELATGAIHARVETDLDRDLPIVGGRRLKARARFLVGGAPGEPRFVLDDVTVWGISLPNDWLAGLKGQDLFSEILGGSGGGHITGVEEFKVEPGKLLIRLSE